MPAKKERAPDVHEELRTVDYEQILKLGRAARPGSRYERLMQEQLEQTYYMTQNQLLHG